MSTYNGNSPAHTATPWTNCIMVKNDQSNPTAIEIGNSKLKQHQIDEIKRLYKPRSKTFNQYQLGKMFKVSQGQISTIINGKRWANESGDAA